MKRILGILLVVCLMLSLVACTPKQHPEIEKTEAPATEAPVQTNKPATEAPVQTDAPETEAPVQTDAPETEAPVQTDAPETEAPEEGRLQRGYIEGDYYFNEYLDLKFARPEGWIFYTEEQLAATNNATAELMAGTDVEELVRKAGQLMDMLAQDAFGSSVNLVIQPAQAALAAISDEQIFQLSETAYKAQFQAAGMTIDEYEITEAEVLGEKRSVLAVTVTRNDITFREYQIWLRPGGDYMGIVTVALTGDADPQEIWNGFSHIN